MQIRPAVAADTAEIARIWHLGWHQAHAGLVDADLVRLRDPSEFANRTAARIDRTWVAEKDGALAGFYMIEGSELYQFYVDADHRGAGVAKEMMAAAEADLPAPRAWLACTVGNDRAAAFYTKCGWENRGPEDCAVETSEGPRNVRIWRFERDIAAA
ncbi:GNAT family N-acetyltransferase [Sulfitobacter sp. HNIBRBA3233]|uniref:GNAT family N-acetyltransferase n=1 Tax=Sulfitobacter marinivivus TaxID=3158558 RepID=UPI0032DFF1CE